VTVDDVKGIKEKIDRVKERKAKAEGAMESIRKRWKTEFGCEDQAAAQAKLNSMREEVAEGERRVGVLLDKVEQACDWSKV
jgi:hypothetical protein